MKWGQSNWEAVTSDRGREATLSLSIFTLCFLIWIRDWSTKNQVWIGNLRRFLCVSGFMQEKWIHLLPLTTRVCTTFTQDFPGRSDAKESACNVGDLGSIPGLRRFPEEGNGYRFQYSCLENFMDRGAWQTTAYKVTELDTTEQLSLSRRTELPAVVLLEGKRVRKLWHLDKQQ